MFWKGKDMFCLEDMSHLAVSFVRKIGQFFWDTHPPESMGNIFLGRGLRPILSLKLWRGNQKIWDWKIRKIWVSGFNVINFAGGFHWRFRRVILKKDLIFSSHQLISWWVKDPPFPNLEIETFRFLREITTPKHVPQLPACFCEVVSCLPFGSLLDTVRGGAKKRWLWKAVN